MLRAALALRFVLLIGSLGAMIGAALMFWIGGAKIVEAVRVTLVANDTKLAIGNVMGATDAFVFAIVLIVIAYSIAFGFVFDLAEAEQRQLPDWMRIHGLGELKRRLIEVILLYLIVDFASDLADGSTDLGWPTLVKPIAILLIAISSRMLPGEHGGKPPVA